MQRVLSTLDEDIKQSAILYMRCIGKDREYYFNNLHHFTKKEGEDELNIYFKGKHIIYIKFTPDNYVLHRIWLKGSV